MPFMILLQGLTLLQSIKSDLIYYKMSQEDEKEQLDSIELYLRTLRKKVDHQLKNPFEIAMASFSFEELATWKNNVMQLDASSKLYAQRVDFLHCGTLHILGSVLTNQSQQPNLIEKGQTRKQQRYQGNPVDSHLQISERLNDSVDKIKINSMLWRQICKKRDAIHQLMLNELSVDQQLKLSLNPSQKQMVYDQVTTVQHSVYLKLLNFQGFSSDSLYYFSQMQEMISELNYFMLNFSRKQKSRKNNQVVQSMIDFDFEYFNHQFIAPYQNSSMVELQQVALQPITIGLQENKEVLNDEQSSFQIDQDDNEDFFDFQNIDDNRVRQKQKKKKKKVDKKQNQLIQKRQDFIDFGGFYLSRDQILEVEREQQQNKYLGNRDFLLLKFVKYLHPFARRPKKTNKSKIKIFPTNTQFIEPITSLQPTNFEATNMGQTNFNQASNTNFLRNKQRIKDAGLPIKQMKKKIRETMTIDKSSPLYFQQIKQKFSTQSPLDILISVLHIAAQEQVFIKI